MKAINTAQGYLATHPIWGGNFPISNDTVFVNGSKKAREPYYAAFFAATPQLSGIGFLSHAFAGHSGLTPAEKFMDQKRRAAFNSDLILLQSAKEAYEKRCLTGDHSINKYDSPHDMGFTVGRGLNVDKNLVLTSQIAYQFPGMSAEC